MNDTPKTPLLPRCFRKPNHIQIYTHEWPKWYAKDHWSLIDHVRWWFWKRQLRKQGRYNGG